MTDPIKSRTRSLHDRAPGASAARCRRPPGPDTTYGIPVTRFDVTEFVGDLFAAPATRAALVAAARRRGALPVLPTPMTRGRTRVTEGSGRLVLDRRFHTRRVERLREEVDYARFPPVHEGSIPSYGAVLTSSRVRADELGGHSYRASPTRPDVVPAGGVEPLADRLDDRPASP